MDTLMVDLSPGDRVRELRNKFGYSQSTLAKKSELSQAAISKIEINDTDSSKHIAKVARALNTSVDFLIYGDESIKKHSANMGGYLIIGGENAGDKPTSEDYVLVPQFEIHASCGKGSIIDSVEVKGGLVFSRAWLREQGLSNPDDLRVIYAKGESMYPFIENGQTLLIDPHDVSPRSGKVYFICIDGQHFVKRLVNMVTHWTIRSDNQDKNQYPDISVSYEELLRSVEIEGRVRWKGGAM